MARRSSSPQLCTCYHQRRQHARGADLQWNGECRAFNVSENKETGLRTVEQCSCKEFEPLPKMSGKETTA